MLIKIIQVFVLFLNEKSSFLTKTWYFVKIFVFLFFWITSFWRIFYSFEKWDFEILKHELITLILCLWNSNFREMVWDFQNIIVFLVKYFVVMKLELMTNILWKKNCLFSFWNWSLWNWKFSNDIWVWNCIFCRTYCGAL